MLVLLCKRRTGCASRLAHPAGQRVEVSVSISPIRDVSGRVTGAATIARDITDQRRAERARREREAQLAESQRIAHVGSWEMDLATQHLTWSDEHYRIFGLEPGSTTQRLDVTTAIHPDDLAAVRAAFERTCARTSNDCGKPWRLQHGGGHERVELAEAVRSRCPKVRFLLATGWGAAIDPGEARAKGVEAVLNKPYQLVDLLQALVRTDTAA
jgi:PAS domain-containing protein